jgi:membrane-associated protease RseP (regulator of RpoE activity)
VDPFPPRKFQDRIWRHLLLFLLTVLTTTFVGAAQYAAFAEDFGDAVLPIDPLALSFLLPGLWYSLTILAILGCHEMGHYLACRYYDVDASLPFFLPAPVLTGTLGAVIRIREPIRTKRALFDIGIAGPLAGFAVALPALVLGIGLSRVVAIPPDFEGLSLGEPLLFQGIAWLLIESPPQGHSINLHPMGFAAWFGLFATVLNLFPVSQLDGGHIAYAVLGRRSSYLSLLTVVMALGLAWFWPIWTVPAVLMIGMLLLFGRHHPPTADEDQPLDQTRRWLALVVLIVFAICFTPAPIAPLDLIGR